MKAHQKWHLTNLGLIFHTPITPCTTVYLNSAVYLTLEAQRLVAIGNEWGAVGGGGERMKQAVQVRQPRAPKH